MYNQAVTRRLRAGWICIVPYFSMGDKPPDFSVSEVIALKQILCLSHTPWQARPSRTQQLLTRLNDAQILFIEPPRPKGAPQPEQGRRMRSHITVYTLPAPVLAGLDRPALHRRNQARAADFIQKAMARHHFREPVLWCTAPDQARYLDQLAYRGLVYDCAQEWGEEWVDEESDLTAHAEVVFAASPGLVERLSPCSDNIALLPNGVNPLMFDRSEFSPTHRLDWLRDRPVFGRVGDLDSKVELEPLLNAALAHPGWTFLLLGRVTKSAAARLTRLPNVVLTGVQRDGRLYNCGLERGTNYFELGIDLLPFTQHGTGDLFTSTLTAALVRGYTLAEAVDSAAKFVYLCMDQGRHIPEVFDRGVAFEPHLYHLRSGVYTED